MGEPTIGARGGELAWGIPVSAGRAGHRLAVDAALGGIPLIRLGGILGRRGKHGAALAVNAHDMLGHLPAQALAAYESTDLSVAAIQGMWIPGSRSVHHTTSTTFNDTGRQPPVGVRQNDAYDRLEDGNMFPSAVRVAEIFTRGVENTRYTLTCSGGTSAGEYAGTGKSFNLMTLSDGGVAIWEPHPASGATAAMSDSALVPPFERDELEQEVLEAAIRKAERKFAKTLATLKAKGAKLERYAATSQRRGGSATQDLAATIVTNLRATFDVLHKRINAAAWVSHALRERVATTQELIALKRDVTAAKNNGVYSVDRQAEIIRTYAKEIRSGETEIQEDAIPFANNFTEVEDMAKKVRDMLETLRTPQREITETKEAHRRNIAQRRNSASLA